MIQVPSDDAPEVTGPQPELTWETLHQRAKSIEQLSELDRVNCQWAIDRVSQTLPGSVLRLAHP